MYRVILKSSHNHLNSGWDQCPFIFVSYFFCNRQCAVLSQEIPSILVQSDESKPAVTYAAAKHQGCLFWIICKWLKLLRKASCLQVIQNSVPSVVRQCQCDIWIMFSWENKFQIKKKWLNIKIKKCQIWL